VSTHSEDIIRIKRQRLDDLKKTTAELERELSDTGVWPERELPRSAYDQEAAADPVSQPWDPQPPNWEPQAGNWQPQASTWEPRPRNGDPERPGWHRQASSREAQAGNWVPADDPRDSGDLGGEHDAEAASAPDAQPDPADGYDSGDYVGPLHSAEQRTAALLNHGRRTDYHRGLSRGGKVAAGTTVVAALVTILVMLLSGGDASWPSSVATVQGEIAKACQNPDVKSEPGQVNFACAKPTRQILWVFSLITSANNPGFNDTRTGRLGLEPITPTQGGEVASSLNLHHPYDPTNPIDSLEVAARAINDIIGGATLTGTNGNPVVQSGLESESANCVRYTGSAALTSRQGFPDLCAKPVSSPAGQAALVADVYRKWVVGTATAVAENAAVLFENAANPGNPRVQSILKHLPNSGL